MWHVTSASNRESIHQFGLDWRRMTTARGIAGSFEPEQQGCFLCQHESELEWFIQMNNTGGAVDVWEVSGVDEDSLIESPEGHYFLPEVIPPKRLRLTRTDIPHVH